jgi:hypothetical protein
MHLDIYINLISTQPQPAGDDGADLVARAPGPLSARIDIFHRKGTGITEKAGIPRRCCAKSLIP